MHCAVFSAATPVLSYLLRVLALTETSTSTFLINHDALLAWFIYLFTFHSRSVSLDSHVPDASNADALAEHVARVFH
jgi:hypothetical protein